MSTGATTRESGFRHDALLYEGADEFLTAAIAFIDDALAADEPTFVVVPGEKLGSLRARYRDAEGVSFADMNELGGNPARIIPAWREFVSEHEGRRLRGIGEPVWPGRSAAELAECQHHEALLNLAFADAGPFWLLCPYDAASLSPDVVAGARRTHPAVLAGDAVTGSDEYQGPATITGPLDEPLPEPVGCAVDFAFGPGDLVDLRTRVMEHAVDVGLGRSRAADLELAINELATNSLLYGGAFGTLRAWTDDEVLVCEIRDRGTITDPLIGRRAPDLTRPGGRGLWMANQLCDLLQLRSSPDGTIVRVHMRLR